MKQWANLHDSEWEVKMIMALHREDPAAFRQFEKLCEAGHDEYLEAMR